MKTNLDRLRAKMFTAGLTAVLISDETNLGWLTGFTGSFGRAIVTADRARFITDSRYTLQAQEEVPSMEVTTFASPKEGDEFLAENIHELGILELGFESSIVTHSGWERWTTKFAPIKLVSMGPMMVELRLVKSPEEIDLLRTSCRLADACFDHIKRLIQPGVSEIDISLDIEFFLRRNGAEIGFAPIVVSGERSARPHGTPSEKLLELGDFVTMDFGGTLNGYNSDITRTVVVGHASDRHREVYELVLAAQMAALAMMKPGVAAGDVDKSARDVLATKDLAKFFGHGLGHGLGLAVHDGGRLGPGSPTILEPGQVWTVEPGVYIPGFGGVRIEDDVVVTETGIEILTHTPKELLVLPQP